MNPSPIDGVEYVDGKAVACRPRIVIPMAGATLLFKPNGASEYVEVGKVTGAPNVASDYESARVDVGKRGAN